MLDYQPIAWMEQRKSWRDYSPKEIEANKIATLEKAFGEVSPPFGNKPQFALVDFTEDPKLLLTYGFIHGAKKYIAGKIQIADMAWEDYGWALEHLVLVATGLGLNTCWVGGTFQRTTFADKLRLQKKEVIPAISPVGYAERKRSLRDQVVRTVAASQTRKMWANLYYENDFDHPLSENVGEYTAALNMVRIAPSAANNQPWRIVKMGAQFHFYMKKSALYAKFKKSDLQQMDMGIAFLHFDWSLRSVGIGGTWIKEDPHLQRVPEETKYIATWHRNP